jgi:iron uptake system component EfeO
VPAFGVVVAAVLAACSSGGIPPPAGGATPAGSASGNRVEIVASEYKFDPSTVTVKAGSVTFHVKNGGVVEHEFEIFKGDQVVDEVEQLVPGLERDLTVTLAAGDYTYVCKLAGHDTAGMKGTLTVQ